MLIRKSNSSTISIYTLYYQKLNNEKKRKKGKEIRSDMARQTLHVLATLDSKMRY